MDASCRNTDTVELSNFHPARTKDSSKTEKDPADMVGSLAMLIREWAAYPFTNRSGPTPHSGHL